MSASASPALTLRRTAIGGLAALALTGCGAGWRRVALDPDPRLPPRQQVQVWQGDKALRWHAVRVTTDSVSGIAFLESPECSACRVTLPREEVDSIRLGNPSAGFLKSVGLTLGLLLGAAVAVCTLDECPTAE
jgi:hypothetical protein